MKKLRLDKWLEGFGVPLNLFDLSVFSQIQARNFLREILTIYKLSGTEESIKRLGVALGCESLEIKTEKEYFADNSFKMDGTINYGAKN